MRRLVESELTGPLLRAGRVLAGISVNELASRSRLGLATIKRAEAAPGRTKLTRANGQALMDAYASLGVMFCGDDQGHVGVIRGSPLG